MLLHVAGLTAPLFLLVLSGATAAAIVLTTAIGAVSMPVILTLIRNGSGQ